MSLLAWSHRALDMLDPVVCTDHCNPLSFRHFSVTKFDRAVTLAPAHARITIVATASLYRLPSVEIVNKVALARSLFFSVLVEIMRSLFSGPLPELLYRNIERGVSLPCFPIFVVVSLQSYNKLPYPW